MVLPVTSMPTGSEPVARFQKRAVRRVERSETWPQVHTPPLNADSEREGRRLLSGIFLRLMFRARHVMVAAHTSAGKTARALKAG